MKRARVRLLGLAAIVLLVATGCTLELQITKQVTNGTSTGPFTVTSTCGGAPEQDVTFHGPGTQDVDFESDPEAATTCTVAETASAGATSVTFQCPSPPMGVTCTPTAGGLQVNVPPEFGDVSVPITVTNDFSTTTTTGQAVPNPPTDVTARLGSIIVSWVAPAFVGTSPITHYVVTAHPSGTTYTVTGTQLIINCPTPGTYAFTVQAVNASGPSAPSSSSNSVTATTNPASCSALTVSPGFTG